MSFSLILKLLSTKKFEAIELTIVEKNKTIFKYLDKITKKILNYYKSKKIKLNLFNEDFFEFYQRKINDRFDIIVMNPPYGRLRILKNYFSNKETSIYDKHKTFLKVKKNTLETLKKKS